MDNIIEKLEELVKLAEIEDDPNTQVVLLALIGSKLGGTDYMLALHIQEYVRNTLLPLSRKLREQQDSLLN